MTPFDTHVAQGYISAAARTLYVRRLHEQAGNEKRAKQYQERLRTNLCTLANVTGESLQECCRKVNDRYRSHFL